MLFSDSSGATLKILLSKISSMWRKWLFNIWNMHDELDITEIIRHIKINSICTVSSSTVIASRPTIFFLWAALWTIPLKTLSCRPGQGWQYWFCHLLFVKCFWKSCPTEFIISLLILRAILFSAGLNNFGK